MTTPTATHRCQQSFLGDHHDRNEHRTWLVVALTTVMMVGEIAGGTYYGSMALVADGWHMATHAAALTIAALAYRYARRHAHDPAFSFGTGKVGELAAFASAVTLGVDYKSLLTVISREQILVFSVFISFFIPCLSTFAILWKEIGRKWAFVSVGLSVAVAVALSWVVRLAF